MYLCGFTLNTISLMALIVATGFVVDDAIVVLENIMRHVENGMSPMRAALRGSREVGFTVLSMSLSLVAVFIPILLMGGVVGRLFREFAVTLSAAIMVSLIVAEAAGAAGALVRTRLRVHVGRLPAQPALCAGAWPADDADPGGCRGPEHLSVHRGAQGFFPAAGYGAAAGLFPRGPGHLVPGDAAQVGGAAQGGAGGPGGAEHDG
ncbi:hypothetical protein G6F57_018046 [Rhizopus arrhizus]|nr:hypothetical protein G6F57_018046 [Rhizopus arrhizus]